MQANQGLRPTVSACWTATHRKMLTIYKEFYRDVRYRPFHSRYVPTTWQQQLQTAKHGVTVGEDTASGLMWADGLQKFEKHPKDRRNKQRRHWSTLLSGERANVSGKKMNCRSQTSIRTLVQKSQNNDLGMHKSPKSQQIVNITQARWMRSYQTHTLTMGLARVF